MSNVVPKTRHFDMKLWNALQGIQPRTEENVANIFWLPSADPTPLTPIPWTARSRDFLVDLNNTEYTAAYDKANGQVSMQFLLKSRSEWSYFAAHQVPVVRSVIAQVVRLLVPSPTPAEVRYAMSEEVEDVLAIQFFIPNHFRNSNTCARDLVHSVANTCMDNVEHFSPKVNPDFDSYPTVIVRNPASNKTAPPITEEEYMTRFRTNGAWHNLAKVVAQFVRYKLVQNLCRFSMIPIMW